MCARNARIAAAGPVSMSLLSSIYCCHTKDKRFHVYRRRNLFVTALENWGRRSNSKFVEFVSTRIQDFTRFPDNLSYGLQLQQLYLSLPRTRFKSLALRQAAFFLSFEQYVSLCNYITTNSSALFREFRFSPPGTGTCWRRIHAYDRSLRLDYSGSVVDPRIYTACANLLRPYFDSARYNGKFKQSCSTTRLIQQLPRRIPSWIPLGSYKLNASK